MRNNLKGLNNGFNNLNLKMIKTEKFVISVRNQTAVDL